MPQAVDYSWARPGGQTIAAAGFVGALRYLGDSSRDMNRAELAELHAAGLAVAIIWETTADRAGQGSNAGTIDAGRANAYADLLGWPADRPIFYAVDFDARPEQVAPYFDAIVAAPGRPVGIYGSYRIIEAFSHLPFRWQCAAWSGNGNGSGGMIQGRRLSQHAHLFQRVGYVLGDSCDANDLLADDWGQWHPDQPIGDDMPPYREWSNEDKDALATDVAVKVARTVGGQSLAEGQPWAQGITNLGDVVNAIYAHSGGGTVDVDKLASLLKGSLGDAVADELADRLKG